MNGKKVLLLGLFIACAVVVVGTFLARRPAAKRGRPPVVKPVQIAGIEYRAPNTYTTEGVVEAWNINSQKLLWKRKIYLTLKLPGLLIETDAQYNFITTMTAGPATNELTIANEKRRQYILDTASQKVTRK